MRARKVIVLAAAVALGVSSAQLLADPPGHGYGPGMGSYGMGHGMMSGYGMGPGMMHGPMGHGMMHGHGPAHGSGAALNLTPEQRSSIARIHQDLRSKQWELMDKIQGEYARRADAPDDAAAGKADDQIVALQQQMLSNAAAARKEMDAVLTKEQRQQLRRDGY